MSPARLTGEWLAALGSQADVSCYLIILFPDARAYALRTASRTSSHDAPGDSARSASTWSIVSASDEKLMPVSAGSSRRSLTSSSIYALIAASLVVIMCLKVGRSETVVAIDRQLASTSKTQCSIDRTAGSPRPTVASGVTKSGSGSAFNVFACRSSVVARAGSNAPMCESSSSGSASHPPPCRPLEVADAAVLMPCGAFLIAGGPQMAPPQAAAVKGSHVVEQRIRG